MELPDIATAAAALLLVLAGIMALTWVLKRFFGGAVKSGHPPLRRRERRLAVVEAAQIGNRHRLLLVRRDDREHLLLIGGATELVIETGIPRHETEAEVSIRTVEPRFDPATDDRTGGYRPADERDTERDFTRDPFTRPGFGSALSSLARDAGERDRLGDPDRPERDLSFGYPPGDYDEDAEEAPRYGRSEPPAFSREERDEPAPSFRRPAPSLGPREPDIEDDLAERGDEHRPPRRSAGANETDDDNLEASHSRILSRFLNKGGS